MSQDFAEVAGVYQAFSTKGVAARYRDEVEGFTALDVIGAVGDDPRFTFARHDVAEMPELGTFDLAVAMYLLHYATTEDELTAMCRNTAADLRPGGRLVALTVDSRFRHGEKNTEKVRVLGDAGERPA